MKFHSIAAAALALSATLATPGFDQMAAHATQHGMQSRPQQHDQQQGRTQPGTQQRPGQPNRAQDRSAQGQGQYYYNGRWVDSAEWQRHNSERDRWAARNQQRLGRHRQSDSSSLRSGIIGFALGAAIVGSQQQAQQARTADDRWDR